MIKKQPKSLKLLKLLAAHPKIENTKYIQLSKNKERQALQQIDSLKVYGGLIKKVCVYRLCVYRLRGKMCHNNNRKLGVRLRCNRNMMPCSSPLAVCQATPSD